MNRTEINISLSCFLVEVGESMLHPLLVVAVREIFMRMCSTRFLAVFSTMHGRCSATQQVTKFKGFHKICIPNERFVSNLDVIEFLDNFINLFLSFCQCFSCAVYSSMLLHCILHFGTNFGCGCTSLGETNLIKLCKTVHTSISFQFRHCFSWFGNIGDSLGTGTSENYNIQKRIGSQTISSMHRSTGYFTGSKETRDNFILDKFTFVIKFCSHDFSVMIGGDATHVVMDGG
mmetsp:Transcript_1156/g.1466  ORF Transcript_1156/g.1466 Transcript_1156/m.1466 type:complete len:232 (-) Transcript_1156:369-1064(-)